MAEDTKKDIIIIPSKRIKRFLKQKVSSVKKNFYNHLLVLIFLMFLVLLAVVTYLPMSNVLKILGLLIGSFVLEDIHHSFKKLCQSQ